MEEKFFGPMPRGICTCGSLRAASRRVSQYYDSVLAPLDLKMTQFSILAEVHRGGLQAPISMHDLAIAMIMDRSTLGHNLRPLVRDELLRLRTAGDDGRKRYVSLTQKGLAVLQQARRLWECAEKRIERVFGKESAAAFRATLLRIANEQLLLPILTGIGRIDSESDKNTGPSASPAIE
jgi:DNA-binding MarR family transcriptional regulator